MDNNLIISQIDTLRNNRTAFNSAIASFPEDLSPYGIPGLTKTAMDSMFTMLVARLDEIKESSVDTDNPFLIQTLTQNLPSWTNPLAGYIQTLQQSPHALIQNVYNQLTAIWVNLNNFSVVRNAIDIKTKLAEFKNDFDQSTREFNAITGSFKDSIPLFEQQRDEQIKKSNELLEKSEKILNTCDERLAGVSRLGLAGSFAKQKDSYTKTERQWLIIFLFALMGMFIIGKCFLFPSLENHEGFERLLHLITNIPLIAPLVWLAWFSALKYSQINKLKEDYAFKTATALALDGYREQADVDDVLDKKLLEIAITNFGENPLRLITQDTLKEAHPLASFLGKDSKPNK